MNQSNSEAGLTRQSYASPGSLIKSGSLRSEIIQKFNPSKMPKEKFPGTTKIIPSSKPIQKLATKISTLRHMNSLHRANINSINHDQNIPTKSNLTNPNSSNLIHADHPDPINSPRRHYLRKYKKRILESSSKSKNLIYDDIVSENEKLSAVPPDRDRDEHRVRYKGESGMGDLGLGSSLIKTPSPTSFSLKKLKLKTNFTPLKLKAVPTGTQKGTIKPHPNPKPISEVKIHSKDNISPKINPNLKENYKNKDLKKQPKPRLLNSCNSPRARRTLRKSQPSSANISLRPTPPKKSRRVAESQSTTILQPSPLEYAYEKDKNINKSEEAYREHLFQTWVSLKVIRELPEIPRVEIEGKKVEMVRAHGLEGRKTVIFDLDETLIHCCSGSETARGCVDVMLSLTFNEEEGNGCGGEGSLTTMPFGINVRPFVRECLEFVSRVFEVVVFTASHPAYADTVLDYLDPMHTLIHHRLYRQSCISINSLLIKDLRIFPRDLSNLIIIDNTAHSFAYQLDNGIPILSWEDDRGDRELFNLIDYLKVLAQAEDVRVVNRKTFELRRFYGDYLDVFGSE